MQPMSWMREANRRVELMLRQMFCMVKDSCRGSNESRPTRPCYMIFVIVDVV